MGMLDVGCWRLDVEGWRLDVGRWKMEDGRWRKQRYVPSSIHCFHANFYAIGLNLLFSHPEDTSEGSWWRLEVGGWRVGGCRVGGWY